ncbi:MAG TPA: PP2C family protein-serine/threonine phosphatase [Bacteroidota bacterium]|mgnify:CR=1 FL=1|nr:PP2C family protein-serine/threonine phosphatase [Bacteroidota bacterium]
MTQRTLYKLIERIGTQQFASEDAMLAAILDEIVQNERISINGGRIWKLHAQEKRYELIHEHGNIESVGIGFSISLKGYPVFEQVARKRTVLADETNKALRRKGIIRYSATGIGNRVEIGKLWYYEYLMAFNTTEVDNELRYMLGIAGQAVTQLLASRRSEQERMTLLTEMEMARDLQKRILPQHRYSFGRYDLYGVSLPELTVGGDFFNYYEIPGDHERLAVSIGDAASKGFAAAVQALFVSGALMMSVEAESKISSMLRRINTINRKIFPTERFLTLCYCELFDGPDGLMLYSNAGHPKPIHYHAASDSCTELKVTGPVIGLFPDSHFSVTNTNIMPDDVLVLYSDGITEANNGEDEYEEHRVMEVIRAHAKESAKDICLAILQDVQTFSAHGAYSDDKTLVIIKRTR